MYMSNAEAVAVTQGTPQWYPGNLNPICTSVTNAEAVIVTQGTPQWYQGNLNPVCTLVMQKGSLSPGILPNCTQEISILYVH